MKNTETRNHDGIFYPTEAIHQSKNLGVYGSSMHGS